jgi:hypothetical protein
MLRWWGVDLRWLPVLLATYATAVTAGVVRDWIPRSPWRVPQGWGRFPRSLHAALFGGVLGLGFLTAAPSVGFFVVLSWPAAANDALLAVMPALCFGLARASSLALVWATTESTAQIVAAVDRGRRVAAAMGPVESFLLAALTATLWMGVALDLLSEAG